MRLNVTISADRTARDAAKPLLATYLKLLMWALAMISAYSMLLKTTTKKAILAQSLQLNSHMKIVTWSGVFYFNTNLVTVIIVRVITLCLGGYIHSR